MRHFAWLSGLLLVVSCSVNPVLNVDGSPSGGGGTNGGGGQGGAATGNGGAGGTGKDGGETCAQLEADYNDALTAARKCTPGAANQCQQLRDLSVSCPGCKGYVNDATNLDTIAGEWKDQDCKQQLCPAIACIAPGTGVCQSTSGGPGGTCQNGGATTN